MFNPCQLCSVLYILKIAKSKLKLTSKQKEQLHCLILYTSLEGTSARHNLHRRFGSSFTGTKPAQEFNEYFEDEASVSKLEHLEHNREHDPADCILSLFTGCSGSTLLVDDDDFSTPVNASTVSHFRRFARLLHCLIICPFGCWSRFTRGSEVSTSAPLPYLSREPTRDLIPGIALKSTLLQDLREGEGETCGRAIEVTRRRPCGSKIWVLSATLSETKTI